MTVVELVQATDRRCICAGTGWTRTDRHNSICPLWDDRRTAELDQAIALLKDARCRVMDLRVLLDGYDAHLSNDLYPLLGKIETHLGAVLLKREDGRP